MMKVSLSFLAAGCVGLLAGCSSSSGPAREATYPVTGIVTFQGKPVAGADITFYSTTSERSAFGKTDDSGRYYLTTFKANDGAVPGRSDVTIVQIPPIAPTPTADIESEDYAPPGLGQSTEPPAPVSTLPAKYANRQSSGLFGVVNADGDNEISFDLTP